MRPKVEFFKLQYLTSSSELPLSIVPLTEWGKQQGGGLVSLLLLLFNSPKEASLKLCPLGFLEAT